MKCSTNNSEQQSRSRSSNSTTFIKEEDDVLNLNQELELESRIDARRIPQLNTISNQYENFPEEISRFKTSIKLKFLMDM